MNGDTNGTIMDDPLDSASDVTDLKTISDQENSEKKISDNGDHSLDATEDSNTHDEETTKLDAVQSDPLVPLKENTNSIEEDSNNTNESYPNSVKSLQSKADLNEQIVTVKLSEDQAKEKVKHTALVEEDSQDTTQDSDELDSEDTSEDDISEGTNRKAIDTVSIHSDSENESLDDEDKPTNNQSDIIFIDSHISKKQNGIVNCGSPSEVHEIESDNDDDCVVTSEEVKSKSTVNNGNTRILRRSRRSLKRKSYAGKGDDDVQLVGVDNSKVKNKKKPTAFMNHVKSFIHRASKNMKPNDSPKKDALQKKPLESAKQQAKHDYPVNVEELYQSIAARGTTVTPVNKVTAPANVPAAATASAPASATASVSTQCNSPPVLPYLTDDMFVVEAPSFIVPYVYEKPSVKAFREFVDNLGKQLEEEMAQEKEKLKKECEEDSGKSVATAVHTGGNAPTDELAKKDKPKKKCHGRRKKDDDDASWDGSEESTAESDDEILSDEDRKVVIKDVDDVEITKKVLASTDKTLPAKTDTYFDCSLGKFFMDIGLNQVQEYVQNDLLKLQNRKLTKEKRSGKRTTETELAIALLTKNIDLSKRNNAGFTFNQKKCQFCSFQTESMLVMSNHFETPHMKNGMYKCNFCPAELRTPHEIYMHMDVSHNVKGKLEKAPGNHQCANCPFEDNGKGKLARHLIACGKRFKPELNLSPPIEWEPPAKIPKIAKSRGNAMTGFPAGFKGPQMNNNLIRPPINIGSGPLTAFKPRPQLPAQTKPALPSRPNILVRHFSSPPVGQQFKNGPGNKPANQQPSISITPLPRAPQFAPPASATSPAQGKGTFVICEICDGYIKDLEQLRNHMQWIHKVKIHPKMIYNRPPLNCQKCQFRFFTDQGLERHLLGTHGLVTSSMQEAANKGKDAGRCPVCGRVYQWKLLHHVAKDHNLTLKPAHLSYKCTVCTATFGMYKQFENHVYSAHRVVAKRVMDSSKVPPPGKAADTPKDDVNA